MPTGGWPSGSPQWVGLASPSELRKDREWPKLDEEVPVWALYLDDSTFLKKIDEQLGERLRDSP